MNRNSFDISPVFYTANKRFAFQRIGNVYRLYGADGYFVKEFTSMKTMCDYIAKNGGQ